MRLRAGPVQMTDWSMARACTYWYCPATLRCTGRAIWMSAPGAPALVTRTDCARQSCTPMLEDCIMAR